jgi:S-adenosylmethionine-diacylgycerolhomoserine-N-methlytransferase
LSTLSSSTRAAHRAFLNRYYGISRHFYDLTRKYYLFGRDRALAALLAEPWSSLMEIGVGTGRNLRRLHRARPSARLGGIDASDEMVKHAQRRCPFAAIQFGFAEDSDGHALLGEQPERALFSYSLSMMSAPSAALANARANVGLRGSVLVVDFGDLTGVPRGPRHALRQFLAAYHVRPLDLALLHDATCVERGPLGYFVIARFPGTPAASQSSLDHAELVEQRV